MPILPRRPRVRCFLGLLAVGLLVPAGVLAQGHPAERAASNMTTAEGFSVELVAAEPTITQPVALEFDDRGRLWVVQYQQYPNPEGLRRTKVDRWSRTTYDRIPEPPPHGPRGADAITILEDTNGDGTMDRHRNFVEGLNLCSGLAFGHGGVFVLQVPYLLFYPDADRDDVPDSDPEVCLTGFGMEDAHSVANSLTWGPDGWLYGNQGSTVTAHIRGIEFQQGVWRYHPVTRAFELFAEGGGNMWGLDFDPAGQEFSSTNFGPYVMLHAVQGAYYWKSFGKHGALHNPFAYGYFDHVAHHNAQGGHVAVGGMIYQGGAFPERFNGTYIAANLLSHNVMWHTITTKGSTFESTHGGVLLESNDTWFAPSDMTLGPDGCLYVADWHDRRTAHPDPDAAWDRSNGRVYRIAPDGLKPMPPFDLAALDAEELMEYLSHENVWFRRRARVLLASRTTPAITAQLTDRLQDKQAPALETLWAWHAAGGDDDGVLLSLLHHEDPQIRRWSVRFVGDKGAATEAQFEALLSLAASEMDLHVRSQLASTAKRLPSQQALPLAAQMIANGTGAGDSQIPLLLWWVVEAHAMADTASTLALFHTPKMWNSPLAAESILPRLVRRFAAEGSAAGDGACAQMLDRLPDPTRLDMLLTAVEEGLQERGQARPALGFGGLFQGVAVETVEEDHAEAPPVAQVLVNTIAGHYTAAPENLLRLRLATRLGNPAAYARTLALAGDTALPPAARADAIAILGRFGREDCVDLLFAALTEKPGPVQLAALDALRRFSGAAIGARLMEVHGQGNEATQERIREILFSKPEWAGQFLQAVEAGAIPPESVPLTQLRRIALFEDADLSAMVEKHWGVIQPGTPEEKLAEMRRMNNELNFAEGDSGRGQTLFRENCAKCHVLFGEGIAVGPDLTQANRKDREYLLVSLVDPSFLVRKEYKQQLIETTDGELLNGVVTESGPGIVTIFNATGVPTSIARDQIRAMRELDVSLMPEGLLTAMPGDDVRDLFAYLQQDGPEEH